MRPAVSNLIESVLQRLHSPRGKRILGWWPWFVLVTYTSWLTSPLWQTSNRVFAGKFSSDNAVSAWYYGWVARSLEQGTSLKNVTPFNFPHPIDRATEFPNVIDATLTAPLWWLLEWPQGWGASQAMTLFVAALGCGALARALGCRGLGIVVAGVLGGLCRQLWKDLAMARMNAVWPGLALLALAALLMAIERPPWIHHHRKVLRRLVYAVMAAGTGALAVAVYPPFLLLLAPAGALVLMNPLRKTDRWGWLMLAIGVGLGLMFSWGSLAEILASRDPNAGPTAGCPNRYGAVTQTDLFRRAADPKEGLSLPGLATGSWILMGLVVLHRRWLMGIGLLCWIGLLMVLSLGPCPQYTEGVDLNWQSWPLLSQWLPSAWDRLSPINDWGRMATTAALLAAVCSGLGIERIWKWAWPAKLIALGLSFFAIQQAHSVVGPERLDGMKWHEVPAPRSAKFLMTAESGAVADLPFDRKQQFLSVLWAPDHPRINPLRPADHPPNDPFIQWLYSMGRSGGEFAVELGDTQGVTGMRVECMHHGQMQWTDEAPLVGNMLRIGNLPAQAQCTARLSGLELDIPIAVQAGVDIRCQIRGRSVNCNHRRPALGQVKASGLRWVIIDQPRCSTEWFSAPVCSLEGKQAMIEVLGTPTEVDGIQIWDLNQL